MQNLMFSAPTFEQLAVTLDNLETSAMLAGLPAKLVALNRDVVFTRSEVLAGVNDPPPDDPEVSNARNDIIFAADHISSQTTKLLIEATWHPILGTPYRRWRTRQLSRVNAARPRPGPDRRNIRRWERKAIRESKVKRRRLHAGGNSSA